MRRRRCVAIDPNDDPRARQLMCTTALLHESACQLACAWNAWLRAWLCGSCLLLYMRPARACPRCVRSGQLPPALRSTGSTFLRCAERVRVTPTYASSGGPRRLQIWRVQARMRAAPDRIRRRHRSRTPWGHENGSIVLRLRVCMCVYRMALVCLCTLSGLNFGVSVERSSVKTIQL